MSTTTPTPAAAALAPVPQYPNHEHSGHAIQFYKDDEVLLELLSHFIGSALVTGNAAIVIGTQAHREGLELRLKAGGLDEAELARQGRYLTADAAETLGRFMVDGSPDAALFRSLIGGKVLQVKSAAETEKPLVAVFGEMVSVLWAERNIEGAIRLEELWNELVATHSISLCCGYPINSFSREEHSEPFVRICSAHSLVIPSDGYASLDSDQQRLRDIARLQQKAEVLEVEFQSRRKLVEELASTKDADEVVSIIAQNAMALMGAEGGCASVRRPEGFVCTKYFHKSETLPVQYAFSAGQELPGKLLVAKFPLLANDFDSKRQTLHQMYRNHGVYSALSIPILDENGEVAAFFEVHNKIDGTGYSAEDQRVLTVLARIGSIALRKEVEKTREIALRHSKEMFRLLVEAAQDYAIFMLDTDGRVSTWNAGAQRIKGYRAAEIIGKHFSCFYPEQDLLAEKPKHELETAIRDGRLEDEGWRIRKDGTRFWANVIITPLRDRSGKLLGFSKVTRDFTERMLMLEALRSSRQELAESETSLRRLSLHLLRTQEEERRRIGRDLHDSLGQYLSVLKMKLDSFASTKGSAKDESASREILECAYLAEECIKEVRTISYLLYPPMLEEMGLKSAISWYLDGFTKRSGIVAAFETSPDFGRLPEEIETALFRVLQECLTNVHRHSGSATAKVRLLSESGIIRLEVADQGRGMQVHSPEDCKEDGTRSYGVGLRGMAERMRQLGGNFELQSTTEGTTIIATVPLETYSRAASNGA